MGHGVGADALAEGQYVLTGHATQALALARANVPRVHTVGVDTLSGHALPAGHVAHAESQRAGPKEPPGQGRHALKAF